MADQRALIESMSRHRIDEARDGSTRLQRIIFSVLAVLLLALMLASQFVSEGTPQHPSSIEESHDLRAH
jgi:hypothetical protein